MLTLCLLLLQPPGPYDAALLPLITAHQGQVAVALKHLQTCQTWAHRADEPMPTASLIKVAILAELYQQVHGGKRKLTDLVTLRKEDKVPGAGVLTDNFSDGVQFPLLDAARLMITLSDNTATNLVIDQVGVAEVNSQMKQWGFTQTRLNAKVYRGSTTSIDPVLTKKFGLGSTSANDMVKLFEQLHRGTLVSPAASKEMLGILRLCHDETMFRRYLNEAQVTAHKTGATSKVRTSAGILQTETGPVALCVLTAENQDTSYLTDSAAQVLLANIALKVMDMNRKVK